MIIFEPWWKTLGILLLIIVLGTAIHYLWKGPTEEDADDSIGDDDSFDSGRCESGSGQGIGGRRGGALSKVLSLGVRQKESAMGTGNTVRQMAGSATGGQRDDPVRTSLGGLTEEEQFDLNRYLLLVDLSSNQSMGINVLADVIHELAGLKARNTPEGSSIFGKANPIGRSYQPA